MLEITPYEKLSVAGEMVAYKHNGFVTPMDTLRDRTF